MTVSILQNRKLLFIGAGPMAEAVVRGLVEGQAVQPQQITVTNRSNQARLQELAGLYDVQTVQQINDHPEVLQAADVVVLAVNPQDILPVLAEIRPQLRKPVVISVAAGVTTAEMEEVAEDSAEVVRVMPNTACAVLESATLVCYGRSCTEQARQVAVAILTKLGTVSELQESEMDGVTAITGCGPAYVYALAEAMQQAAIGLGVTEEQARAMVRQTLIGASKLMEQTGLDAADLRKQVTSPNGVTMAALEVFEQADLNGLVNKVVHRAIERTNEITEEMRQSK